MERAANLKIKKPHLAYLREPTNFNTSVCKRAKSRPVHLHSIAFPHSPHPQKKDIYTMIIFLKK